jgi:hypothetical protein
MFYDQSNDRAQTTAISILKRRRYQERNGHGAWGVVQFGSQRPIFGSQRPQSHSRRGGIPFSFVTTSRHKLFSELKKID